jgi:hypothetical protein
MSLVGTQLGHYRLIQFLNGGGMGEVYLAEDLSLSRQVAIKVMKTEGSLYPNSQTAQEAQRLFQREMKVIAALDHPHILTLYEAGEQSIKRERITYMVMPYCPAGSLADWIAQYHGSNLLSPQEVSQLLSQAGEALQYAHDQRILHLDIKPQNFLVRRQQDQSALPNLLLADFGVSKIASTTKMSGTARGTFDYMAPEQLGNQPVPASDQYALAIMAYELLTGRTPFEGAMPQVMIYQHANVVPDPPSKINSSLPQALDAVILRALAKKPEERFRSVREFAQAFAAALQTKREQRRQQVAPQRQQAVASPPPREQVARQSPQRRKGGFWWALLFGVIAGSLDCVIVGDHGFVIGNSLYFVYTFQLYPDAHILHLVLICLVVVIAGFIAGRIVLRKRIGTLAGCIAGVVFTAPSSVYDALWYRVFVYHDDDFLYSLQMIGIIIALATLLGFIGGLLGTIGRARRRS